ncbi:MAG: PQQ-dependent sugar dehydrogenase [Chloroflexota bacterium]
MKKRPNSFFKVILVGWVTLLLYGCGNLIPPPAPTPTATPLPSITYEVVTFNVGLVTAFEFLPDGRLMFAEQNGAVKIMGEQGEHQLIHQFEVSRSGFEDGLLGMTLDPDFAENQWVYTYRSVPDENEDPQLGEVAKHRFDGQRFTQTEIILELPALPEQRHHFGGGLSFGPDGYLYMVLGDLNRVDLARDAASPISSMLRFGADGSVPADNPFEDSISYAWGFRNGFGFDWHPETGMLYAGENGDACDDELNLIEPGNDYGWGLHAYDTCPYPDDAVQPLLQWTPTIAPSGLTFISSERLPELRHKLLMCGINFNQIHVIDLSEDGRSVLSDEILEINGRDFFCQGAIAEGPDGWLYTAMDGQILRVGRY